MISGTITNDGIGIAEWDKFDKVEERLCNLRVVGNKVKKVELFHAIQSKHTVAELVKSEIESCKKKQISTMIKKNTNMKYIKCIRFLNGPCTKYSNILNILI